MSRDLTLRVEQSSETTSPQDAQVVGGHTPTPWHMTTLEDMGPDNEPYWYIDCERGARAGMEFPTATTVVDPELGILTEADAAFIVKAVNSHEANEAKIAAAVKALEDIAAYSHSEFAIDRARTTLSSLKEGK